MRSSLPAEARKGNLARMTAPTFCWVRGRRRDFAFGRRLKPGQFSSVGMPQSSNIYKSVRYCLDIDDVAKDYRLPLIIGLLRSCLAVAVPSSKVLRRCTQCSTYPPRVRTSRPLAGALALDTIASRRVASSWVVGLHSILPYRNLPLSFALGCS